MTRKKRVNGRRNYCLPKCSPHNLFRSWVTSRKTGRSTLKEFCSVCARRQKVTPTIIENGKVCQLSKETGFYDSKEWKTLRYQALIKYQRRCMCCHSIGVELHVDHIKPRSRYPELELDINNLQVLCRDCNIGKGAWDETDWRQGPL